MAKTLRDIAEKLNLSVSTVSCALKDGPKVVSPDIRKAVRRVAQEMGYRPNRIARSLVTGQTKTIGVVPMYVDPDTPLHSYLQLALNGIFNAANELRHDVLVYTARDHNRPQAMTDDLLDSRADGVIFISPKPDAPALQYVWESGLPFAVLFEEFGPASFTVDNGHGVRLALDHLLQLGHRRISHITGDLCLSDGRMRHEAFVKYMERHDVPAADRHVIAGDFTSRSGREAATEVLDLQPRPTAVFCGNDDTAFGLIDALRERSVQCPQQISVVGFDGVTPAGSSVPQLTTLGQPARRMAAEALRSLVQHIQDGTAIESRIYQPELIVRESTARVPIE